MNSPLTVAQRSVNIPSMSISDKDRNKYLADAKNFDELKDELGKLYLDTMKFLKSQISEWYVAITAVCFAVGGISISVGSDKAVTGGIVHPSLFWWGSILLIANGIFIFLVRKVELDKESSNLPNLKQAEADFWTARNIALELSNDNNSRVKDFEKVRQHAVDDYEKRVATYNWYGWTKYIVLASLVNVVFGLLVFPIFMLSSQLLNEVHISFKTYQYTLIALLIIYIGYTAQQAYEAAKEKKLVQVAEQQIKSEIER